MSLPRDRGAADRNPTRSLSCVDVTRTRMWSAGHADDMSTDRGRHRPLSLARPCRLTFGGDLMDWVALVSWGELRAARSDLWEAGRDLLYQFGVGLAFLATVRRDGGPRTHPVCPLVTPDHLFAFIVPSPKCGDLERDGRYALHSFPSPENEDAFYLVGRARRVDDAQARDTLAEQFAGERSQFGVRAEDLADQTLFEFDIETCMLTRTTGHGDPKPTHVTWHA